MQRGTQAAEALAGVGSVINLEMDVTRQSTIEYVAGKIDEKFGRLDILINNAGISAEPRSPPSQTDLNCIRQVYETNVFGVIAVTQVMLPMLLRSKAGRIVNLSSSLGSLALASDPNGPWSKFGLLGYNTSKTALNGVTVQFANELRQTPVKVNAACPGYVATDLNGHSGYRTADEGARVAVMLASLPDDGPTGGLFSDEGAVPW
jgi:NAD(P)-dependent dehydrogenase (short-subunit alcohol dehydrogenase family)